MPESLKADLDSAIESLFDVHHGEGELEELRRNVSDLKRAFVLFYRVVLGAWPLDDEGNEIHP